MFYNQDQIDRANQADLVSFLQGQGEQLTHAGQEYEKKIKEVPTHTIHYGYIYDGEELVDEVLVMICRHGKSRPWHFHH